jgi:hypothetical protein
VLSSVTINDGCLRGAFRSAIKVAICPVYGIKQRAFLPLLQHIVGPAFVGPVLDVYLVIRVRDVAFVHGVTLSQIGLPLGPYQHPITDRARA